MDRLNSLTLFPLIHLVASTNLQLTRTKLVKSNKTTKKVLGAEKAKEIVAMTLLQ